MINFNTDLTSLQNIALSNKNAENAKILGDKYAEIMQPQKQQGAVESSPATDVEISDSATSSIDDAIANEEILNQKLNYATNIYDSLSSIRTEISSILAELNNPNSDYCIEDLENLDSAANNLIEKVISSLNSNMASNIVGYDYISIYLNGLNALKKISIGDEGFATKLEALKENVKREQEKYYGISENIYSDLAKNAASSESLVGASSNIKTSEANTVQREVILNSDETLRAVCSKLTPETVIRLLQN